MYVPKGLDYFYFQDLSVPVVFERVTSKLSLSLGELLLAQKVIAELPL